MVWTNYFVTTTRAFATEGHLPADQLRRVIKDWHGAEAYHCAYDLEDRPDFSNYEGLMRPALGYVWFDFDSKDGGIAAHEDTKKFCAWLSLPDLFVCYSGSKGFHVGVPFGYFGPEPSRDLGSILNRLATKLKATYPTLDTTIYNANRKFRALGSKHPKTGLYKIRLSLDVLRSSLDAIKALATKRGDLTIPIPELRSPLAVLRDLLSVKPPMAETKPKVEKQWHAPTGEEAFKQCGFLSHARDDAATLPEPEWYAALSIVSRFQNGRQQSHQLSHKHKGYSVGECNSKIDQALAESGPRTCESISQLWDGCHRCPLYGKINSPVNIFETRFWDRSSKGALIPKYNELLEEFIKNFPYKTIADMKTVYIFKETHYVEFTPIELKAFAEEKFQPKPKEKERQEFSHKVFSNSVDRRDFFIRTTENLLNFKNGVFDIEARRKDEHSPRFGFRGVLPYDYNPTATCETFDAWIKDVMLGDESLVKILQEFMGYVVRGGEYKYHKALWLSGSGRNGKSTFLSVLKALIGTGNYSTLSIRQIINDKFSSADLDGKIANFSEETSPEELSDSGPFKNLTGDGELLAQKKYGDPYSFRNRAKLIMTYNEVPMLKDLSPGMLSRPIIIPWKKDLTDEKLQDKNLKNKLVAELPGIFNFALEGWNRLEEQGTFTFSPKSTTSMREIESASCSATRWLEEQVTFCIADRGKSYDARALYVVYKAWHAESGGTPMGEMRFLKRINLHHEIKKRTRHTKKGKEYFAIRLGQKDYDEGQF